MQGDLFKPVEHGAGGVGHGGGEWGKSPLFYNP